MVRLIYLEAMWLHYKTYSWLLNEMALKTKQRDRNRYTAPRQTNAAKRKRSRLKMYSPEYHDQKSVNLTLLLDL